MSGFPGSRATLRWADGPAHGQSAIGPAKRSPMTGTSRPPGPGHKAPLVRVARQHGPARRARSDSHSSPSPATSAGWDLDELRHNRVTSGMQVLLRRVSSSESHRSRTIDALRRATGRWHVQCFILLRKGCTMQDGAAFLVRSNRSSTSRCRLLLHGARADTAGAECSRSAAGSPCPTPKPGIASATATTSTSGSTSPSSCGFYIEGLVQLQWLGPEAVFRTGRSPTPLATRTEHLHSS